MTIIQYLIYKKNILSSFELYFANYFGQIITDRKISKKKKEKKEVQYYSFKKYHRETPQEQNVEMNFPSIGFCSYHSFFFKKKK